MRKKVEEPPPKDWSPRKKKVENRFQRLGRENWMIFCSGQLLILG
jgi:hypothetical protein